MLRIPAQQWSSTRRSARQGEPNKGRFLNVFGSYIRLAASWRSIYGIFDTGARPQESSRQEAFLVRGVGQPYQAHCEALEGIRIASARPQHTHAQGQTRYQQNIATVTLGY